MRDLFVTDTFELDLSRISISYQEENPRFKDTFFTQFSLPFEFYMNADLRVKMGNYTAINALRLKKKHEGYHVMDGRARKGTLEILSVEGELVQAQIESGFEQLPNFEKKLCDLPLAKVAVDNIYEHANVVCRKRYPEVDYNFPRVVYNKDNSQSSWEAFEGFLNHTRNGAFINNSEDSGNRVVRNIIHPMPYLLYVLKKGFADAGYTLAGDILTDEDFLQQVIYSGKEYYKTSEQQEVNMTPQRDSLTQQREVSGVVFGKYQSETTLDKVGKWRLVCNNAHILTHGEPFIYRVRLDGVVIREGAISERQSTLSFTQVIAIETGGAHQLRCEFEGAWNSPIELYLNIIAQHDAQGNVIEQVINNNEVDLKRAVPDITFGDLVKTIKNWKNYDLEIQGDKIFMNRIHTENRLQMKDFRTFAIKDPKKTLTTKESYLIKFPDMDEAKFNYPAILIDENGMQLSQGEQQGSTQVNIEGYCLPKVLYRGEHSCIPRKNGGNVLGLIWYDGLRYGNKNEGETREELLPPKVTKYWEDWYKMRLSSYELSWSFIANKNQIREFALRDTLYVYGQRFFIKSITKNTLSREYYQVEITLINV
jgi:hypothetical protein